MDTELYFKNIEKEVRKVYSIAEEARAKNFDPIDKVEIPLAMTMAAKVVGLISTIYPQMTDSGIDKRILELEEQYGKLDATVVFKIAEEVAKQKFCKFSNLLESIDAGIRIGFAYTTLGVVSSPIEGFTGLKLGKTKKGEDYFIAYFSGPIRSAGTTASCLVLMLIDYLRELFGFAKYDPTEEEIRRYITECSDYHERVTNLQYMGTEEELEFLSKNLPIQIAGEPTEKLEVSNYKNLERVDTNYIRGGMTLIFSEGLAQKAAKGFRLLNGAKKNGIKSTGFDFLKQYIELHEKRNIEGKDSDERPTYIKDLVAGRPIFGHPSKSGGFRMRYGRSRVNGFSSVSLSPATMVITDSFISIGTQLKIEKPTKGCCTTVCDSIEGPIVKLFNGNVKKIKTKEEAKKLYPDVEEIIYLGDILFPYSDVVNRNAQLIKPGYVEEWWNLELEKKGGKVEDYYNVPFEKAKELSKKYEIPLHPHFIFYWTQITKEQFLDLIELLKFSWINSGKLILPFYKSEQEKFEKGKRALEILGVEHTVSVEHIILEPGTSELLFSNLGLDTNLLTKNEFFIKNEISKLEDKIVRVKFQNSKIPSEESKVLFLINSLSEFKIKDKAGEFIGSRMGRPEKAKLRKLAGSPNILFPVGKEGGRLRSVQAACEEGYIKNNFPLYYCENCDKETIYPYCEICGKKTRKKYSFLDGEKSINKVRGEEIGVSYETKSLDINYYLKKAKEQLGIKEQDMPPLIKGVRGTSSEGHMMENLSKGILRAKYNLQVNKDGTIRFDATELPLVAFKPKEISVDISKLKELGYDKDVFGNDLINEEQIIELMPHDILLPSCPESPDEKADDVFIKISNFIDELLVRFYKLKAFHNVKKREDLVGQLGVCMAPHNCAGVVCRIIGFSESLGLLASPYMHAAIRRDCDGDEAAVMLLSDVLLNFSREFLPSHRGGTQDAPLVLNAKINAGEVDDQILDFELISSPGGSYPLELYESAEKKRHSSEVKIDSIKTILKEGKNPFINLGYTHETSNFNDGVRCSSYKFLSTMQEKVQHQMELVERLRAVDTADTAKLIIDRHFLRDIKGNLRNFSTQSFRCVKCNTIFRRPPLSGICDRCGGKLIFTVNEGGIRKYLDPARDLAKKYNLSTYILQNLDLVKRFIDSIFGRELEKQEDLGKWF